MKSFQYNSKYFEQFDAGWTPMSFPVISRMLRSALQEYRPRDILDFGCGSGSYADVLKEIGAVVDGCDIADTAVMNCKDKYRKVFKMRNAADVPAAYDMVFSTEVIEHINDHRSVLKAFNHSLRSHGTVVMTTTAYSPTLFIMLYNAKNTGVNAKTILVNLLKWFKGYFSEAQRDAFVLQWCFESVGGHYHGFLKKRLMEDFRAAGFSIEKHGFFYVFEPIQMPFLYSYRLTDILRNKEWPILKRFIAAFVYLLAHPLNYCFKKTGLFANNIFIVARKND